MHALPELKPARLSLSREGRPINVVLLGPPAAGKGTQAELLVARYGMVHISTGDLLRARKKYIPELAEYMDNGRLVPDEMVSVILKERLQDADCLNGGVLLDGFPRTRHQAESLQAEGVEVSDVIHLQVADDVVIERMSGRCIDPLSGKNYHYVYNPPPAAILDRIIQRDDDTIEKVKIRLKSYHEAKDAIVAFYGQKVHNVHVGDGTPSALPKDVRPFMVFDRVKAFLEGDTYWGSVVRSELTTKAFECGSYATSMMAVTRYFEHSRFRMLWHGCLSDASGLASRVALRAQVIQLAQRLQPLQTYQVFTWIKSIGDHAVSLGHRLSRRLENDGVEDVAIGSAVLVFLGSEGQSLQIPRASEIRDLVAPPAALADSSRVNELGAESPEVIKTKIGPRPDGCWCCTWSVSADEMDLHGYVHEAACLSYFERMRVNAAAEGGYKGIDALVLKADTARSYVGYDSTLVAYVSQGDRVRGYSWIFQPASPEDPEGTVHLAFEICDLRDTVLVRGSVMLNTVPRAKL